MNRELTGYLSARLQQLSNVYLNAGSHEFKHEDSDP